ncbi:uncharacterized protein LOC116160667 [Photinus pyralis]|uniref:uncharacterized protein LOC116160667 n=1 Tax=Photinus pyralis TaxID=7054 RepID=UPI00126717D2|nr:uncharacterized protein LOC116160667 [Photinus pyralis]
MHSNKKRVNYTQEEKKLLIHLVDSNKNIIENKDTNAVSNHQKDDVWKIIEQNFNKKCFNVFRDANSLRKQWSNMKQDSRKKAALERQELYKTGGGVAPALSSKNCEANEQLVLDIINKKTVLGLRNEFDSDVMKEPILDHPAEDILGMPILISSKPNQEEINIEIPCTSSTPSITPVAPVPKRRSPRLRSKTDRGRHEK